MQPHGTLRGRGGQAPQVVELTAERIGQREELTVLQRNEARPGILLDEFQELFQVEHAVLVDDQFPRRPDPFADRLHVELEGGGRRTGDDAKRPARQPLAGRTALFQRLEQLQAIGGIGKAERPPFGGPRREERTTLDQGPQRGPLGLQVAPRLDGLAVDGGEDRGAASARIEPDPRTRDRLHCERDRQAVPERHEAHPGRGIGIHAGHRTRRSAGGALHAYHAGQRRDRLDEARCGLGGDLGAVGGNRLQQFPLAVGESRHLAAAGRGHPGQVFRLVHPSRTAGVRPQGDDDGTPFSLLDEQLRLAAHDLHREAIPVEDVGMAGERVDALGVHVGRPPVPVPMLPGVHGRGGLAVLRQEEIDQRGLLGQPEERHLPALGPPAALASPLLLGRGGHPTPVVVEDPYQSARRGRSGAPLARCTAAHPLDGLQPALPLGQGFGDRGQRDRAERGVRGRHSMRAGRATAAGAPKHRVALGHHPREPVGSRALAIAAEHRLASRRPRQRTLVMPAHRQPRPQGADARSPLPDLRFAGIARPRSPRDADGLHLRRPAHLGLLGNGQDLPEQLVSLQGPGSHQPEEGEHEGARVGEDAASPRSGSFQGERFLDAASGFTVVAPEHRGERTDRGEPGPGQLLPPQLRRECGEDGLRLIGASLQDTDEGGVGSEREAALADHPLAGLNDRLWRGGGLDHVVEAPCDGGRPDRLGERLQEVSGEGIGHEPPDLGHGGNVGDQPLDLGDVAGHQVRAQVHRLGEPRGAWHLEMFLRSGEEWPETAVAVRDARQRERPLRRGTHARGPETARSPNWVGGGLAPPVPPHHRT